ncbi:ADP-ribosylation factor-like protein 10 isoform X3 [Thamnophis elegans]|uniref:ADP-ribosylation factor-like protein 10 isoform X3 n=1 Tax=Thamnophis elegans TaxID=35005 RepID=UPI00137887C9|nr:ADP-ribosylation factor-like protein 10 isoform X3 [Thamnophis elegans]
MAAAVTAFRHLSLALSAAVAALGSLLFIAWKVYFRDADDSCVGWRSRWERQLEAELRACNVRKEAEQPHYCEYQVLILGLDGAGKSTILHYVCSPEAKKHIAPTQGFNSVQLHASGLQMDLLEDSADGPRLHIARQELHCLLAEDPQLPLIVLANKQDKNGALSVAELQEELALHNLDSQRKFFLLPTSATYAGLATAKSVLQLKHLLVKILASSSKMDSL